MGPGFARVISGILFFEQSSAFPSSDPRRWSSRCPAARLELLPRTAGAPLIPADLHLHRLRRLGDNPPSEAVHEGAAPGEPFLMVGMSRLVRGPQLSGSPPVSLTL